MQSVTRPKKSLVGIELIRHLAASGDRIFSMDRAREVAPNAGLNDAYLSKALHHLRRSGWIVPLRRGLNALSSAVPGFAPVHDLEIADALVSPAAISHCWPSIITVSPIKCRATYLSSRPRKRRFSAPVPRTPSLRGLAMSSETRRIALSRCSPADFRYRADLGRRCSRSTHNCRTLPAGRACSTPLLR